MDVVQHWLKMRDASRIEQTVIANGNGDLLGKHDINNNIRNLQ